MQDADGSPKRVAAIRAEAGERSADDSVATASGAESGERAALQSGAAAEPEAGLPAVLSAAVATGASPLALVPRVGAQWDAAPTVDAQWDAAPTVDAP